MVAGGRSLTFLFTDVEGSTRRWEDAPDRMREDLAHHDELLTTVVARHRGEVFKYLGDGVAAVFEQPGDGVAAAVAAQRELAAATWQAGPLRVRIGLHSGDAQQRDGDWFGPTVNRTARLHDVAHGGQIVISGTTAGLVDGQLPGDVTLVDLGEHRLRDLTEPERIHQVLAPDLGARFAPLRTEHHPSRGVPAASGRLVDRTVERQQLDELVRTHRVITITGPPGGGKTRLAVELARDERDRWPGGIWFCSLASLLPGGGTGGVAARLAELLGSVGADGSSPLDGVLEALRERQALVVLDGCDHVIADAAAVVDELRDRCPGTVVVATSRERLDVADEHLLDLPTLPDDDAVALFTERAQAVRSSFDVDEDRAAVRSLISHLDGLPLAIELAAARVRTHAPAEIDHMLRDQGGVLRTPRRRQEQAGPAAHHHDLESAIGWSYDLLEPIERRLFRHLAVFAASFTPADVVGLLPDLDRLEATDLLDGLVERSLVSLAPHRSTDRTTRYRLLTTLRAFAGRRLSDDVADRAAWERWAAIVVDRATAAAGRLAGPDEARWVGELADLWEDLRAAHHAACDRGDAALAVRLVRPLRHHSTMRGLEVGTWAERTVGLPRFWDQDGSPEVAALAAERRLRSGDFTGARDLAIEALDRGAGDDPPPWIAQSTLTLTTWAELDRDAGVVQSERLHDLTKGLVDVEPLAPAVSAYVTTVVMTYAGMEEHAAPAVALLGELGDRCGVPSIEAMARLAEGRLLLHSDPVAARAALDRSIALATPVDNVLVAAQARSSLADLSAADDPQGALRSLHASLQALRDTDDESERQQLLLRTLGPLVSLEQDDVARRVASFLRSTFWRHATLYRAAVRRLGERSTPEQREEAQRDAAALGLRGVADLVVSATEDLVAPGGD